MDKAITDIMCYIFRLIISENKSPKEVQFILGTSEPITRMTIRDEYYEYNPELYIWERKELPAEEKGE